MTRWRKFNRQLRNRTRRRNPWWVIEPGPTGGVLMHAMTEAEKIEAKRALLTGGIGHVEQFRLVEVGWR